MKSLRALAFSLLAVFSLSGCLQQEKIIRLKADGSGTLEETVVMTTATIAQMQQMTSGLGGLGQEKPAAPPKPFSLLDEKKLEEAAGKMGEGVTFVSAKPMKTAAGEGFTAVYAFADINQLKVSEDLGDSVPSGGAPGMSLKSKTKTGKPITFTFAKGAPATLTVNLPQPRPGDLPKEKKDTPAGGDEMAMVMMQQMFKDMKVGLAIEVAGKIVQSNAEYQDGARVTLMEMDFNKVLANPEKFKALAKAQPKSVEDAKTLVKGIDGIKAETQPVVTVKFQ